ncbi:MAG: 3-hydroxyacyl-CoA dehydrogenase NAD-binding domain-containing protein, partial [SAR324 cluster bacterium]|nr:3-hydroxyacyl-CoA dehydrogenase NAD-binding domain-containing protein [SAR324 cluster bacterium]
MSQTVSYRREGTIGVITVDNPPVNALSQSVRQGLMDCVAELAADEGAAGGVLICEGRTFIAGADIKEFGKPPQEPPFGTVMAAMENLRKPLVAAIHGTALGGGLETALCCHYRCAVASAQVGLPEVKLGLLPGAGGTQRLPRLVGVRKALEMIVSGDPIGAETAFELGVVDHLVEGDLRAGALAYAESLVTEGRPFRKVRDLDDKIQEARENPGVFEEFRKSVSRKIRGFEAPDAIIESVRAAVQLPFDEGLAKEKSLIDRLMPGVQSIAQRYLFFAEREVAKIPDVPRDTPALPIRKAAVVGAGTMGGGIAMCFANAGIPVILTDAGEEALNKGLETIRANYASTVSKGRLEQGEMDRRMALIQPTVDRERLGEADIVVEAVFEEMALKKEVFAALDKVCRPETILATNTSTLDVDEIAAVTSRPGKVIGAHFFSPANVMRLLE